ncbi:MAG TPA: hypothetical protein VMU51_26390 [Mycobacteriales bacterium]|nr:hypothetical protein [Mycobacteriales bacterium]
MLYLLNPFSRRRKAVMGLRAEARKRGLTVDELRDSMPAEEFADLVEGLLPRPAGPDPTAWGLPPRSALVATPSSGVPAIEAAVAAAGGGDWQPAADLLARSYGEWDLRALAVIALGRLGADDDRWLAAWRAAAPDDGHLAVVEAEALTVLAWQLRGAARANQTSAAQFTDFRRMLPQAEAAARRAVRLVPDDPTPWLTLVAIATGLGYDHAAFAEIWAELTDRAPLHRLGHESALQYWCKKWRGSHEEMFGFAERAAALAPSLAVLVVQAAWEQALYDDDPAVWRTPGVQDGVDRLLDWLAAGGAQSLHRRSDLGWAAAALVRVDRPAEALPLFRELGTYAGSGPWRYSATPARMFDSYRLSACRASPPPGR